MITTNCGKCLARDYCLDPGKDVQEDIDRGTECHIGEIVTKVNATLKGNDGVSGLGGIKIGYINNHGECIGFEDSTNQLLSQLKKIKFDLDGEMIYEDRELGQILFFIMQKNNFISILHSLIYICQKISFYVNNRDPRIPLITDFLKYWFDKFQSYTQLHPDNEISLKLDVLNGLIIQLDMKQKDSRDHQAHDKAEAA